MNQAIGAHLMCFITTEVKQHPYLFAYPRRKEDYHPESEFWLFWTRQALCKTTKIHFSDDILPFYKQKGMDFISLLVLHIVLPAGKVCYTIPEVLFSNSKMMSSKVSCL